MGCSTSNALRFVGTKWTTPQAKSINHIELWYMCARYLVNVCTVYMYMYDNHEAYIYVQ